MFKAGTVFAPLRDMAAEGRKSAESSHAVLQIDEDVPFARREWKIQRAGWFFLGLLVFAAILGLFGHGLFSGASVANGGLQLQYQRFEHFQRPTSIKLRVSAKLRESTSIIVDRAYINAIRIKRIMPQPERVEANSRGLIYHFAGEGDPITVTFHFQLQQFGMVNGQIGLADGPMLSLKQFVYP